MPFSWSRLETKLVFMLGLVFSLVLLGGPFLFSSASKTCEVLNRPQGTTCVASLNSAHHGESSYLFILFVCLFVIVELTVV